MHSVFKTNEKRKKHGNRKNCLHAKLISAFGMAFITENALFNDIKVNRSKIMSYGTMDTIE